MAKSSNIVRYTAEELDEMILRGEDQTDWARVDAMTEEELEASIDFEEEGEPDWTTITVELPLRKKSFTMRYDPDILEWFRAKGPGYQSLMNAVLRSYVQAHRK